MIALALSAPCDDRGHLIRCHLCGGSQCNCLTACACRVGVRLVVGCVCGRINEQPFPYTCACGKRYESQEELEA